MKYLFLILFLIFGSGVAYSQEVSLYDKYGMARAYIAEDLTIYMWNGDPVAYLHNTVNGWIVYGFNGRALGWYDDGIIYDTNGDVCGFQRDALGIITFADGMKALKSMKPLKGMREIAPIKPMFSNTWAPTPLTLVLRAGE